VPLDPEDRRRLDELLQKREAREGGSRDIPEPTVELIVELVPHFANTVRAWLAEMPTGPGVPTPVMSDGDLLHLGVAVAKRSGLSRNDYWMLADMTAEAITAGDLLVGARGEPV
jgi:hypothetical protein